MVEVGVYWWMQGCIGEVWHSQLREPRFEPCAVVSNFGQLFYMTQFTQLSAVRMSI